MERRELSSDELRAALANADKHMRLDYISMILSIVTTSTATSIALKVADFANPTHVLVVAAAWWLFGWMIFGGSLLQSRQLAANARMLRALELIDERLAEDGRRE